ncbi:MAG: hypothetical protein ACRD4E_11020, partial [Bryobacteraceae bacterium]
MSATSASAILALLAALTGTVLRRLLLLLLLARLLTALLLAALLLAALLLLARFLVGLLIGFLIHCDFLLGWFERLTSITPG